MAEVLVAHQRHRANCLCGWSGLGRSLPEHQADELTKAGYGELAPAVEQAANDLAQCRLTQPEVPGVRVSVDWLRRRSASIRAGQA